MLRLYDLIPLYDQNKMSMYFLENSRIREFLISNTRKISSSFLKESILLILNLDYTEEDE